LFSGPSVIVKASCDGLADQEVEITASAGSRIDKVVLLEEWAIVEARVDGGAMDQSGRALFLMLYDEQRENARVASFSPKGIARIEQIKEGRYWVVVEDDDDRPASKGEWIDLAWGQVVSLDVLIHR
jgi:hypothetical protein